MVWACLHLLVCWFWWPPMCHQHSSQSLESLVLSANIYQSSSSLLFYKARSCEALVSCGLLVLIFQSGRSCGRWCQVGLQSCLSSHENLLLSGPGCYSLELVLALLVQVHCHSKRIWSLHGVVYFGMMVLFPVSSSPSLGRKISSHYHILVLALKDVVNILF